MIRRCYLLTLLLVMPSLAGVSANLKPVDTAAVVEAVLGTGPIKSFMLQRENRDRFI